MGGGSGQKHQNMRDIIYGPPRNKGTFDQMFETVENGKG